MTTSTSPASAAPPSERVEAPEVSRATTAARPATNASAQAQALATPVAEACQMQCLWPGLEFLEVFRFVGQGRGSYKEIKDFGYVGDGRGDFLLLAKQGSPDQGLRMRRSFAGPIVIGCLVASCALGLVFYPAVAAPSPGAQHVANATAGTGKNATSVSGVYDCWDEAHSEEWPSEQRRWCCERAGRGCHAAAKGPEKSESPLSHERWNPPVFRRFFRR